MTFPARLIRCRPSTWNRHGLDLQVFLQARDAHLAPDAALLVAAEGRVGRKEVRPVDVHRAGADAARQAQRPLRAADDRPGQAIDGLIGEAHRVIVVAAADPRPPWSSDALLRNVHVVGYATEDRGPEG